MNTVWEPKEGSGTGEAALAGSLANNLSDQAFKPNPVYLLDRKDGIWFGDNGILTVKKSELIGEKAPLCPSTGDLTIIYAPQREKPAD